MKKSFISILRRAAVVAAAFISFSLFINCSTGLGEEVDVEAPVLSITSPQRNTYHPKSVVFEGTCTDNKKVERVEVNIVTNKNGKTETIPLGKATIDPATKENWTYVAELEEGERTLQFVAYDGFNNTSVNSIQNITVLIDETPPRALAWYIDRGNGKQTPFMGYDALKKVDINKSENVNIPQNVSFTVYGSIYDAFPVADVVLHVYDEYGNHLIEKENSGDSLYSPEFKFTHEEFVAVDPSLSSGMHYLQFRYFSKDIKGNSAEQDLDWLLWYPESDKPNFDQSQVNDGVISAPTNSGILIDIFDDDELDYVFAGLIDDGKYETISGSDIEAKSNTVTEYSESALSALGLVKTDLSSGQIKSCQIETGGTPGTKYLVAYGMDTTGKKVHRAKIFKCLITDDNLPILFIDGPEENTVPVIDEGTDSQFTITGYTLDTQGCKGLYLVYVPSGYAPTNKEKQDYARSFFYDENEKFILPAIPVNGVRKETNGAAIWNLKLNDDGTTGTDNVTWKKQKFSRSLDILEDFKFNGNRENTTKFFEFVVVDENDNVVYQDYKLEGDTSSPEITVNHDDMYVCDYQEEDLELSFTAGKSTGLAIDPETYRITRVVSKNNTRARDSSFDEIELTKTNKYTFTSDDLKKIVEEDKETQPKFRFYAKDVLGNSSVEQRTVVLTALPKLEKITSDAMDGTYKAGDVITIQAVFSSAVNVTGSPTIPVKYSASDENPVNAVFSTVNGGNGTDTLKFTFTVPAGRDSSKVQCLDVPILLNGGKIETTDSNGGNAHLDTITAGNNLQDLKKIAVDGTAPVIRSIELYGDDNEATGAYTVSKELRAVVKASENVLVSGSPVLKFVTAGKTVDFTFQGIDSTDITFTHKITSDDPNGILSYNTKSCFAVSDIKYITDKTGNQIALASTGVDKSTTITIDTTAPVKPVLTGIIAGTSNRNQTLKLTGLEAGSSAYYSTNNGVSWISYPSEGVLLTSGSYQVTAKQVDAAGNTSPASDTISLVIDSEFPEVVDFACNKADGTYASGTVITFRMSFEDKVKASAGAKLKLFSADSEKYAVVVANSTPSTSVTFTYTVQNGDDYDGLSVISAVLTGIVDTYGNTPAADAATAILAEKGTRPGIKIDAVSPTLVSVVPKSATTSGGMVISAEGNVVTLTFNENVYKENGTLTLKRKGEWAIPPVLSTDEFMSIYNAVDVADKEILTATANGDATGFERLDARTGISVGPYRKITHGLTLSNGKYIPDTTTKYVLDFKLGLYSGTARLDQNASDGGIVADVSKIRKVLEKTGYHKQTLEVSSSLVAVNGNKVTVTFPDKLADGREWEFVMDAGAFRDSTGNLSAEVEEGEYSFWSDKVAAPVVRVDRYSHGWGAVEPKADGTTVEITTNNQTRSKPNPFPATSAAKIAPTGYARVRIDCETPDAVIKYSTINGGSATAASVAFTNNGNNDQFKVSTTGDISSTSLVLSSGGTTYTSYVIVGDGKYDTSSKDYVTSYATKTGFTQSGNGFEGVFKTAIHYYRYGDVSQQVNVEGGTAKGGMPSISGFPLRDAGSDPRYTKNMYLISGEKAWAWVTYEIISPNWALLMHKNNYSSSYPTHNYGQMLYLYNFSTWE